MGELANLWEIFCNWLKGESLAVKFVVGAFGSLLAAAIIALVFKLPQRFIRWIRRRRRIAMGEDFPFDRVRPEDFGRWLQDNRMLTCYENPFVPKEEEFIYKSHDPASSRRRMYLGAAETGKTRAAYEWVKEILKDDSNAEILIPKGGAFPNPIKEDCVPNLAETVILFYDDMHKFMLPKGQPQRKSEEGRVLSPEDRFENLAEVLGKSCTRLYIVCTARWEHEEKVQPVESYHGVWRTFDILTLKDAPKEEETEMIEKLAEYHDIQLAGEMAEQMADRNKGRSYENTVEFLKGRKGSSLGEQDLEEYAKGTPRRWESQVFHDLQRQNRLVAQLVGAMYTLRFELGLPPYERFVLRAAAIRIGGLFRKRRLRSALNLLCQRGGFSMEEDMILCHDFQLEISARVSPPVQECLKQLHRRKHFLSDSERLALAEWHFYQGVEFGEQGELEAAAGEWEKYVSLRKDHYEAYNNWGVALSRLASFRQDEGLFQESFEKYKRAVELEPDSHQIYHNWGLALSDLASLRQDEGLFQESIGKYKRAVELKPDYDKAYSKWGVALHELASFRQDEGLFQESIKKYERAVELQPDDHEAYSNWGLALYDLASLRQDERLFQESFGKYKRAADLQPDDHEAYYNWGLALYELARLRQDEGLFQESIEKYERAVELKPDLHEAYSNWGLALYELAYLRQDKGLYQESIEKYKRAVELQPDSHEAYYNWGLALYELARLGQDEGLFQKSIKKYERAVELKPDLHEAYSNWGLALSDLARLRQDEGLFQESFEKYERAVELKPDYRVAYSNWSLALSVLARLHQDEGLFQKSIKKFNRSLETNPAYWLAHFNMACSYAQLRLVKEACEALDSAFSLFPDVVDKVRTDSDFDPIRDDPLFRQWVREHEGSDQ